jgi:hypothetical protein
LRQQGIQVLSQTPLFCPTLKNKSVRDYKSAAGIEGKENTEASPEYTAFSMGQCVPPT